MNKHLLVRLLKFFLEEKLGGKAKLLTFKEAGMLASNDGLVVRFDNEDEFQITLVQSKIGKEDEQGKNEESRDSKNQKGKMDYPQNTGKKLLYYRQESGSQQKTHD
ncbi:hypothetical protein OXPF_04640 [Oxobacter pfennigii]|uniref:Uncharacterized protein n=1 Tax=Oxobacter pfennigii TaxID=36849 RepID=A0A0N8NTW7_9CLOT|nr:hypothetical protein [Oxobacter pfennigii]KPU45984.1 hypothetical protein OXPF_04640 [Oxobacter pfennigii]